MSAIPHPRSLVISALALAILASGCRQSLPLAPKHQVDGALSNIGLYCGEATKLITFGGHEARVRQLDAAAKTSAQHLVAIMRHDPDATYLGQSMREVVAGTASATSECRLTRASDFLSSAARSAG
jgi:hypothetical protein